MSKDYIAQRGINYMPVGHQGRELRAEPGDVVTGLAESVALDLCAEGALIPAPEPPGPSKTKSAKRATED